MRRYRALGLVLLLDLVGAGGALLVSLRAWQTIRAPRPAPLSSVALDVSGRTLDAAPTALALVALAGVVAVLSTRGLVRRIVGAVLAIAGAGLVWRAVSSAPAIGTGRARSLLATHRRSVDVTGLRPQIVTHPIWVVLTVACGVFVAAAGGLLAWRGHRWQVMSTRYEAPDPSADRLRASTTMWSALDRGEDPTA